MEHCVLHSSCLELLFPVTSRQSPSFSSQKGENFSAVLVAVSTTHSATNRTRHNNIHNSVPLFECFLALGCADVAGGAVRPVADKRRQLPRRGGGVLRRRAHLAVGAHARQARAAASSEGECFLHPRTSRTELLIDINLMGPFWRCCGKPHCILDLEGGPFIQGRSAWGWDECAADWRAR